VRPHRHHRSKLLRVTRVPWPNPSPFGFLRMSSRQVSPSFSADTPPLPAAGRQRVLIENVRPHVDHGRYPVKRTLGEKVVVEADIFADGHDVLSAVVHYRANQDAWREIELAPTTNDHWHASFAIEELGLYEYTVEAWIDHVRSWRRDLEKKAQAGQDVGVDLKTGAAVIRHAIRDAAAAQKDAVEKWLGTFEHSDTEQAERVQRALDPGMAGILRQLAARDVVARLDQPREVLAEPERARFGAWYELFPRSCGSDGRRHGTFADLERQLSRIAAMGFDVLYLPPIHPIGDAYRKGRNNRPQAEPGDPGSPWAIGGQTGGHKAIHPELGTLEDFRRLVQRAQQHGLQIALDIAYQCSPDHPYVREHPEWFKQRADGTIQYAENPPKKYQDIYPFDFECDAWESLWIELRSVLEYWISQGVTIFRVDNPHTKAFPFWEWAIRTVKAKHPEVIFLSEAFTRPKVMYNLAKLGFTQSYNYFPWRNTRDELRQFMTENTRTAAKEFFRPNLWPNTPDILPQYLQYGGRPGFIVRFVLAATLGASYGIYGPAFELCVHAPRAVGEEEYLDSEKYEIKAWDLDNPVTLEPLITQVNRIRHENPALHSNDLLAFHDTDNDQLLVYGKRTADRENQIVVALNLDPHHPQSGHVELDLPELGIASKDTFQVHDLLTGSRYLWRGARNFIAFDPARSPVAIFRVRRRIRSEEDFDYFM
jgi:starch synthase (maltosyl-transferring)